MGQVIQNTEYPIRTAPEGSTLGTRRVRRGRGHVDVSDPHRTVVDIIDVPAAAGGVPHSFRVLQAYIDSEYTDQGKLIEYGDRDGRATVFERLGYLAEHGELAATGTLRDLPQQNRRRTWPARPRRPRKGADRNPMVRAGRFTPTRSRQQEDHVIGRVDMVERVDHRGRRENVFELACVPGWVLRLIGRDPHLSET